MSSFIKLPITHDVDVNYTDKVISEYKATEPDNRHYDISYYQVHWTIKEKLMDYIPRQYQKHFYPSAMVVKSDVFVHIDDDNNTNINFYVNTGKSITRFYEPDYKGNLYRYGETGIRFFDELKCIEQFVPNNGDIYVINTSVPHSVEIQDVDTRIVYTVHSKLSFHEVCEILSIPQG